MEDIDKEISEMKISLNARARIVAEEFLKNVSTIIPYVLSLSIPTFSFYCSFKWRGDVFCDSFVLS